MGVGARLLKIAFCFSKMKKLTTEEFIEKARKIHGDKYDYSKVEYVNNSIKVCIICPVHGEFWQTPNSHLSGRKCASCSNNDKKNLIFGIGINDCGEQTREKSYRAWFNMFVRCYNKQSLDKRPTYNGCYVGDDWKYLSNFKKWYNEHYVEGWCLDKDLLVKGNKEYAPDKCCFVPQEINVFLSKDRRVGNNPFSGIYVMKSGNFAVNFLGKRIGTYKLFEDAFASYKKYRETRAKNLADKWKDKIEPRVYEALYNYKIEITD